MAGYTELKIEQGATFQSTLALTDVNDDPIDLTSYTFSSQLRKSYESEDSVSFDCEIISNNVLISLTYQQTANLEPGKYVFDFIGNDGSNTVIRIVEGTATVSPGVTR